VIATAISNERSLPAFIGPPSQVVSEGGFRETMQQAVQSQDRESCTTAADGKRRPLSTHSKERRPTRKFETERDAQKTSGDPIHMVCETCVSPTAPTQAEAPTPVGNSQNECAAESAASTTARLAKSEVGAFRTLNLLKPTAVDSSTPNELDADKFKPESVDLGAGRQFTPSALVGLPERTAASGEPGVSGRPTESSLTGEMITQESPGNNPVADSIALPRQDGTEARHSALAALPNDIQFPTARYDGGPPTPPLTAGGDSAAGSEIGASPNIGENVNQAKDSRSEKQPVKQSTLALPVRGPGVDLYGADTSRQTYSDAVRTEGRVSDHKKPTAESKNDSVQHNARAHENQDAAELAPDGRLVETSVHGLTENNRHLDPASASPSLMASLQHTGRSSVAGDAEKPDPVGPPNAHPDGGAEAQSGSGTPASATVNAARLVERLKESEINLSVRSVDFGDVAIHTAISHERLSAQISLERNDLSKIIANEVPALQSKLSQEHGIQATIEVQQQGQSFSGNGGQSQSHADRSHAVVQATPQHEVQGSTVMPSGDISDERLDIRV